LAGAGQSSGPNAFAPWLEFRPPVARFLARQFERHSGPRRSAGMRPAPLSRWHFHCV